MKTQMYVYLELNYKIWKYRTIDLQMYINRNYTIAGIELFT
jgi:hypothetical protein